MSTWWRSSGRCGQRLRSRWRAIDLYRGDLLEGLSVREPAFEEWLAAERERLRDLAVEALARLLAHQAVQEAVEPAVQTALRLLALEPLQEAAHRVLMRLYARQGRAGAALRQYQACVRVLHQSWGKSRRWRPAGSTRSWCRVGGATCSSPERRLGRRFRRLKSR